MDEQRVFCGCGQEMQDDLEKQNNICYSCMGSLSQEQSVKNNLEQPSMAIVQDPLNPNRYSALEDKVRLNIKQSAKESRYDITVRGDTVEEIKIRFNEIEAFAITKGCKLKELELE